jgi:hypothetical protein
VRPSLRQPIETGGEHGSLVLADIRSRPQRVVVPSTPHFDPWARWSPDGTRFAYRTSNAGSCGDFSFWSVAADGSDVRQLGSGQLFAWGPSHDSFAIERGCRPDGPYGPLVFTDRSGREHVVAGGWAAGLVISPRGDRIAYETYGAVALQRPGVRLATRPGNHRLGNAGRARTPDLAVGEFRC